MSDESVIFSNPENLPLEKLKLPLSNGGVMQQIKALDPHWVENRELTIYESPPTVSTMIGAVDTWISKMRLYLDNLQWLLRLPQYRFWSTVLYHPQCMDALVSFLQEARPPYLPAHENKEVEKLYMEIRRLVFIIFSRLITNKESKSQWMSREYMAGLIYDNFVFTIPIIWDICLVYGEDNAQHVARLLEGVFALQPRYEADAAAALTFVKETFKYIILQVNKDYGSDDPPNLPETFKGFSEIRRPDDSKREEKLTLPMLKDLVVHLLDTAMTLRIFLEVYPKSVQLFRDTNFIISAVQVYEYGVPPLYERLREAGDAARHAELEPLLEAARADLIDVFREVLAVYKNAIFSGQGNIAAHVEDYLEVMMDGLSERLLIQDYHACYPLHEDLEMLKQAYPDIDPVKTDFILQAVYANIDDTLPENHETNNAECLTNGHVERVDTTIDNPQPGPSVENEIPTNVKEDSLISEVKDILPHLGDGFVLKCLQHYGFNSARVINCVLEDNLAEPLRGLDRSLPLIPEDILDQKFLETGIERLNVFDGDQFDLMTRDDVDLSRIHVGKRRSKYRDLKDMLDDKTEVKQMADIYTKYNLVCEEESMYSDEYDDTYDESAAAEAVPRGDSRDDERRPLVTPRVLRAAPAREEESEDEEEREESSPATGSNRNRMDFCMNPEELRARREANLQARRGRGHRPPPAKSADVTGKPRGQGQDKEVLVNRERKEKHKSTRGNHGRRQGAQWKRSQGLLPS